MPQSWKKLIVSGSDAQFNSVFSTSITGSSITGSFSGDGNQLTNINSASYALTASYALISAAGGGSALSSSVVVESYTFVGNNVTTNYQISKSYSDSSVTVTVGGLTYINPNDYSISGSTIVFVEPPLSASNISVKALMNVAQNATGSFSGSFAGDGSGLVNISAPVQIDTYTFDADGATTVYAVSKSYAPSSVIVSVDGLTYTNPTDYTVAGTTITFIDIPTSGSTISVRGLINTSNATGSFTGSFVGDGSGLTTLPISVTKDVYQYTANGVTTNYTLSRLYDISSLNVSVAGLRYAPITDYTLNLFTLSLLTAPPSGANIYIDAFVNTPTNATGSFSGSFNGTFNGSIVTAISSSFATTTTSSSFATTASAATSLTFVPVTSSFATTTNNLNGGTANYIPLWSSATVQSSSTIYQLTGNIGVNNIIPSASLHVSGTTMVEQIIEKVNVTGSAPPTTFNVDLTSGSIFFRSASTAANWTANFRGNTTTPLNSMMYNGQSITATVLVLNGATAYSASAYQIDGASIIPRWQGGTSGSANANSLDAHQFTIIKVASASYVMLGSITKYT